MRVLVLAPHTDDGEFGCGGSIARFLMEGDEAYYVAFSAAEKSVPAGLPKDTLRTELFNAMGVLGVKRANVRVLGYEVRDFPAHRQAILEDMLLLRKEIEPNLVLLPSTEDTHQDHQTVRQEGFRAFKSCSMFGYEIPWNNLQFRTTAFIALSEDHLSRKAKAIEQYHSQVGRAYASPAFLRGLARVRGTMIGVDFAEAFELIRLIRPLDRKDVLLR